MVVMNADASSGVDAAVSVALDNRWLPLAVLMTGLLFLLTGVGATLTGLAAFRKSNRQTTGIVDQPEFTDGPANRPREAASVQGAGPTPYG
jgi:hypothetical protein